MDEPFDLELEYKGQEYSFTARLLQLGYTHQFAVDVNGQEVRFEPDEERNYRALIEVSEIAENKAPDIELLKTIAGALEDLLK